MYQGGERKRSGNAARIRKFAPIKRLPKVFPHKGRNSCENRNVLSSAMLPVYGTDISCCQKARARFNVAGTVGTGTEKALNLEPNS